MAAVTQHRPHDALAGRRFGAFSGKTESAASAHPVGRITQHRPHCGIGGRRFGSFAGKSGTTSTEWDIAASLDLPALAGTLTLAGDLTYSAGETELAQSGTLALSGSLALAGDLTFDILLPLEQSGAVALSGSLSLAGDLAFSDEPIRNARRGGSGFARARKALLKRQLIEWLTKEEPSEEVKKAVQEIKAGIPVETTEAPKPEPKIDPEELAKKLIPRRLIGLEDILTRSQLRIVRRAAQIAQERDDEDILMLL